MKKSIFLLGFASVSLYASAQVSLLPSTNTSDVPVTHSIRTKDLNMYLNAKVGIVSDATNGNIFLNCGAYDDGDVGIGITPASFGSGFLPAKLTIGNDFATDSKLRLVGEGLLGAINGLELSVNVNDGTKDVNLTQLENANMYFKTNNTTRMTITGTGNVGVGISTLAASTKFQVSGNARVDGNICYTGAIGACSDRRFKTNITPIANGLATVLQLQGMRYDWRVGEFADRNFASTRQIGFIAQDVEPLVPEMVHTDTEGYKSVDYGKLTPILVEAIKTLNEKIERLEQENRTLMADVQRLKSKNLNH